MKKTFDVAGQLVVLAAVSLFCAPAFAEGVNGGCWAGYGMLSGDVTYQVGGRSSTHPYNYRFPLSELKWPMKVSCLAIGQELNIAKDCEVSAELTKSFTSLSGKMEDSDWTDPNISELKTIYSTSDADLNSFTADIDFRWWDPVKKIGKTLFSCGAGAGFLFEQLDWKASNLDQYLPPSPNTPHIIRSGIAGTFTNTADIPYIQLLAKIEKPNSVSLMLRLGYSPAASIYEIDNHLLRQIYSTTSLSGSAYKGSLVLKYFFSPKWWLMFKGDWLSYDISGVQNSFVYGNVNNDLGDSWEIEQKTFTNQYLMSLSLGMRF